MKNGEYVQKAFVVFLILFCGTILLTAAVPGKMSVQGVLRDSAGDLISDDAAEVTFTIYDAEEDGTELWTEDRTLFIEAGRMNVYLGELEPLTYAKIGGQNELWLSVTYDGEEMSRIQLGAVPYAVESQYAQQAGSVGKYNESTLDDMFVEACPDGSYLRGWTGTTPICQTDESGGGGGSYTAGYAIVINGSEISVDQSVDFYTAGTGIDITDGVISVSDTLYALSDHNHDARYYLRETLYTQSELNNGALDGRYYTGVETEARYYNYHDDGSQTNDSVPLFSGGELVDSPVTMTATGNIKISGDDNDGTTAALHIVSGDQEMLLDGNEVVGNNNTLNLNTNEFGGVVRVGKSGDFDDEDAELDVRGNIKTNTLQVASDVEVYDSTGSGAGWKKPFRIEKYSSLGNDVDRTTDYSYPEWCASIAGFDSGKMDIDEGADAHNKVYMAKDGGKWHIIANIPNADSNPDDWTVRVLFIREEFADCDY